MAELTHIEGEPNRGDPIAGPGENQFDVGTARRWVDEEVPSDDATVDPGFHDSTNRDVDCWGKPSDLDSAGELYMVSEAILGFSEFLVTVD